jgi:ribonuclease BN (tRNA processing enzyme)
MEPERLIRQFDRDGDGRISRQEAPERMRQRWAQIDTDGDGFATLEELRARDARVGRGGGGLKQKPAAAPDIAGSPPSGPRDAQPRFQPAAKFSVVTIGTGSPRYDPERSGPSAAIQYQGRYALVDMGNGTQARLAQAGITPRQIDALVLTHHHLDHNEEFVPLFINTRLMGGRPEIVGPPGTAKLVDSIGEFYAEDIAYRLRRVGRKMDDFGRATVRELRGGESLTVCGLKVKTARVNHTIHTVAYRFEADGRSIVVSGDLAYSDSLIELAKEADVLVMDAGAAVRRATGGDGSGPPGLTKGPAAGGSDNGPKAHSTAEEVATMAQKANVRRLVLTHVVPGKVDEEATRLALAESFHGEVIVGRDLLEVTPVAAEGAKSVGHVASVPGKPESAKAAGAARVYVHAATAAAQPDGRTWATAFATVQEGIDAAARQDGGEVWVAQGTYKPTTGTDRSLSIQLRPGVAVYGGFAGTETRCNDRRWEQNPTIFSGDIGREGDATDNSQHVVIGADDAILDGVTVAGGHALEAGPSAMGPRRGGPPGGPFGQPPIHITPEAILRGPNPSAGAGMVNYQCAPTIRHCTFRDNAAGKGGALYNMVSRDFPPRPDSAAPTPLVVNCRFLNNYARGRGGAVANDLGTSPVFRGCTFIGNSCDGKGGAIYDDFGCSPTLVNCLFAENRSSSAGAIGNDGGSSPRIVHCTFTRNVAREEGAALYQGTGPANNPVVFGCILWGNRCDYGPAEIFNWHDNDPQVSGSCVQGGYPGAGNLDRDPAFVDVEKGHYELRPDSPCRSIGHTATVPDELLQRLPAPPLPGSKPRPGVGAKPRAPAPDGPVKRIHVNATNARGPWDGASWQTAFRSLADALAAAGEGRAELWVAAGTYLPTTGQDRSSSFVLRPGVELYGGFRSQETDRSQRDWRAHATILSGDIGRSGEAADNSYHVVIGADHAVLDGFVIRDGNADGRTYDAKGGGLINYHRAPQAGPMVPPTGFSPMVRNCLFTHNRAVEGGAVYNYDRSTPQFSNCRFVENAADYGGAMVDRVGVRSAISGCVFQDNSARWRGGALYLDYGARPTLTDCRFVGNRCGCHGGALSAVSRASQLEATIPLCQNCSFVGNRAQALGGAIADFDSSILGLAKCTLSDNQAGQGGGAVALQSRARAVLLDCRLSGNRAERGPADLAPDETSTVSHSQRDWPDQTAPSPPAGFAPPPR